MDVLLIRHADPDYAHDTITELGHAQARALADHLEDSPVDVLYVSPQGRAQATAHYTAVAKGLTPVTLDWLREQNGNWEGNRWAWNVSGAENLAADRLPEADTWAEHWPYGPLLQPQYEALANAFDRLLAEHGYVKVGLRYRVDVPAPTVMACFCHAGTILSLLSYLLHWPLPLVYSHLAYDPTGVTRLEWVEDDGFAVPKVRMLNDLSHLLRHRLGSRGAKGPEGD